MRGWLCFCYIWCSCSGNLSLKWGGIGWEVKKCPTWSSFNLAHYSDDIQENRDPVTKWCLTTTEMLKTKSSPISVSLKNVIKQFCSQYRILILPILIVPIILLFFACTHCKTTHITIIALFKYSRFVEDMNFEENTKKKQFVCLLEQGRLFLNWAEVLGGTSLSKGKKGIQSCFMYEHLSLDYSIINGCPWIYLPTSFKQLHIWDDSGRYERFIHGVGSMLAHSHHC